MKIIKIGVYKHTKSGKLYKVISIATHSETLEDMVIYESLYERPESRYWVRPAKMFMDKVIINGKKVKRFEYIGD